MPFYIKVPLSAHGVSEEMGNVQMVDTRAHASELLYGDAAYLQGLAQQRWPDLDWAIQHVRTAKYIVKGESKDRKT